MKLNVEEFQKWAAEAYHAKTLEERAKALGVYPEGMARLEAGAKIGDSVVKHFYNMQGEKTTKRVIDFEDETLERFKNRHIIFWGYLM